MHPDEGRRRKGAGDTNEFRRADNRPPQGGPRRSADGPGGVRGGEFRGGRLAMWVIFGIIVLLVLFMTRGGGKKTEDIGWSEFVNLLAGGQVKTVVVRNRDYSGEYLPGRPYKRYHTTGPELDKDPELREKLAGLTEEFRIEEQSRLLEYFVVYFLPVFLLLGIIWFFFFRQLRKKE